MQLDLLAEELRRSRRVVLDMSPRRARQIARSLADLIPGASWQQVDPTTGRDVFSFPNHDRAAGTVTVVSLPEPPSSAPARGAAVPGL